MMLTLISSVGVKLSKIMKKLPDHDHVGHSYIYTPDLDSENQRSQRVRREESIGCCGCEETSLSR